MSLAAHRASGSFSFGPFLLLPARQLLLLNGDRVRVGSRALDILTVLVSRAGELVSKQEIVETVWPGMVVEDGNLKVNISALRRALGDSAHAARYLTSIAGRGYRFVADVKAEAGEDGGRPTDERPVNFGVHPVAFGPFLLHPGRRLLLREGCRVRIGSRAFELLVALVARAGQLVSKRELLALAWPGVVVEESNLKANMTVLRRALDDDAGVSRYIVTVTGRGYRFISPVICADAMPLRREQDSSLELIHSAAIDPGAIAEAQALSLHSPAVLAAAYKLARTREMRQ